jgi:hypothetical protein
MLKLLPLILENVVDQEEDLGKPHVITEAGYNYLKSTIDSLNKKAAKWGVPSMELKILKEEFVKKTIFVNAFTGKVVRGGVAEDPAAEQKEITVKQYEIQLIGEPPRIEGYKFIAKIEHTEHGNILNYAPKESSERLPHEYRTGTQKCDVCNTNRDRNNTFILKLEKDDPQRFPQKHSGDFIMVGSSCLKRFLPSLQSANSLMGYAEMIEMIRDSLKESADMSDDFGGGGNGYEKYIAQEDLGFWISAVYLYTGKYISKKKAQEFSEQGNPVESTVQAAFTARTPSKDYVDKVYTRVREDEDFKKRSEDLTKEFMEWSKTKDFDAEAEKKPEYSDFFHNLKVLSKQNFFKRTNSALFGALFATFLRDKGDFEKKAALKKSSADFTYFGEVGQKTRIKVKVNKIKEYESQYGQGLIVNMEGEQTATDSSGQSIVKKGNVLYFTSNFELEEGEEAEIEATVKSHQPNKYTQIPETQITRAKIVNFITHPEKNAGKAKVKDLSGTVKIDRLFEKTDWGTGTKQYFMDFSYDIKTHPDMTINGTPHWPVNFTYMIPDEATYQSLKQYENKLLNAKWSLDRASKMEKVKNGYNQVGKFTITQVLGDIPPKT